jgi:phage/plasmid-like protein (TIGR03299 family)
MPASVESMFSVRELPWHGEGQVLDTYPENWEAARTAAGLDWDPIRVPTARWTPNPTPEDAEAGDWVHEPGWDAVIRDDSNQTLFHVRDSLNLITNTEMGEIMESLLETDKNIKWETGGVLEGGRLVWMLVTLDEPITIAGDKGTYTLPMIAVTNRHDGWGACVARATMVRIVCANTFHAAELEGETTKATFRFVHRGDWRTRMDDAREAVTQSRNEVARYQDLAKELLGIKVNANQRELFVRAFIPKPPDGLITDRVSRNVEEAREAVRTILNSETTNGVKGTAYGLLNAAGEYLDHTRKSQSWETKLNRCIITPEALKRDASKLAREVAQADVTKASLPA